MAFQKYYKIIWAISFKNELGNEYHYINDVLQEPNTADNFYKSVITEIHSLSYFPEKYSKVVDKII